jgi:hypothetical protein
MKFTDWRKHKIWPPHWEFAQQVTGDRKHPNLRREEFARQAIINRTAQLRGQCGVLLDVSHPEYGERITGKFIFEEDTTKNRVLSKNLLKVVERFHGKTVKELGGAEVSEDFD